MKACPVFEIMGSPPALVTLSIVFHITRGSCTIFAPGSFIDQTPGLEASDVAQRFVMGLMFFSLAWTIALLYQLRTGYSMSLIVTSLVISTMFMCTMLNFYASGSVQDGGNTFLTVNILGNFIGSLIVFFRLQNQH